MAIDWTDLFKKYKGEWVALKDDEKTVIAHGKDVKKVWNDARKTVPKPILMQVPTDVLAYVG
ncbi:hypothetical protein BVY00_00600 [bacterium G20]|nr:hypothetical protein BVY00_00600 [bacterium G20]